MCGIAGQLAIGRDRRIDMAEVRAMVATIVHRGPDDDGFFEDRTGRAGLGMRRLSIIDVAGGKQPIGNEDDSVVCVFNGEIYNFQRLRAELEAKGHVFRTSTDTEVIVHLYEEEGTACVNRLRGMFAFALWDQRAERLLIARDRLGKKPLYYEESRGTLSFASEIHALYVLGGRRREIDLAALDLYLTYSYVPAPHSIFTTIRKLPPGHVLIAENGSTRIERYWSLAPQSAWGASRQELVRALRTKLEEAVAIRLVSDVPLGSFLSGGTDSSTVVALMSRASAKPVRTFSIGFDYEPMSELPHARVIAERYRTDHHEFRVSADAAAILPAVVRHFGEPFGDSSALPTWYVSEAARRHVTVVLNGDGGDELFGGYAWYRTGLMLDRAASLAPRWLIGLALQLPLSSGGRARRWAERLAMDPPARFASLRRFLDPSWKRRLYSSELLQRIDSLADRYLVELYQAGFDDVLSRMQHVDLMSYLPEDLLVKVDRMTMAHSLEARSPLLDHELLELSTRIPAELKVGPAGTKLLLREAVADLFPVGFLDRPKMGFSVPLARWLRGELRTECERKLLGGALADRRWFDAATLRQIVEQHMSAKRDWSAQLWNLLMLAEWLEAYDVAVSA